MQKIYKQEQLLRIFPSLVALS